MTRYLQEIACKNTHYWCTYHEGEFCALSPSRDVMHKNCKVVAMEKPKGRVDVKKILKNPRQRQALMVDTIVATQAREGISTTLEQAVEAYLKVRKENGNE